MKKENTKSNLPEFAYLEDDVVVPDIEDLPARGVNLRHGAVGNELPAGLRPGAGMLVTTQVGEGWVRILIQPGGPVRRKMIIEHRLPVAPGSAVYEEVEVVLGEAQVRKVSLMNHCLNALELGKVVAAPNGAKGGVMRRGFDLSLL